MRDRLWKAALTLLGFGVAAAAESCDSAKMDGGGMSVMYGTPTVRLLLEGTVTDPAGKPIPGIQVQPRYGHDRPDTYTSDEGRFALDTRLTGFGPETQDIYFTDVDGAANGMFEEKTVPVTWTEADRVDQPGGDGWFRGTFHPAPIDVTLVEGEPPAKEE